MIHIVSDYILNFHVRYLHKSCGNKMPYSSHNSFSTFYHVHMYTLALVNNQTTATSHISSRVFRRIRNLEAKITLSNFNL